MTAMPAASLLLEILQCCYWFTVASKQTLLAAALQQPLNHDQAC